MTDETSKISKAKKLYDMGMYYSEKKDNITMLKCLKISAEFGNTSSITKLGQHYERHNMPDKMLEYYNIGSDKHDTFCIAKLAKYYEGLGDIDQMIKYLKRGIELHDTYAIRELAEYYEKKSDYDKMMEYYDLAIAKYNDHISMTTLIRFHDLMSNYNEMVKYCHMIINYDDTIIVQKADSITAKPIESEHAMRRLMHYHKDKHEYTEMFKYCTMLLEKKDTSVYKDLGDYYSAIQKYDLMIEYYVKAINIHNRSAIVQLANYYLKNNLLSDGLNMFITIQTNIKCKPTKSKSKLKIYGNTNYSLNYYVRIFIKDPQAYAIFVKNYKKLLNSLDEKDNKITELNNRIEELEHMPEGPKYAEARDRFNKNADILNGVDDGGSDEGLDDGEMDGGLDED
ncbi:MAG: hypothetical protein Faunusvirus16_2 [Faunusvirus sp.]|jgi:tetratricopeptide (TPR) repeat protein|uniref:Uncharacterized protein n=1 Tax=Faunusvirus sp. TaxID=2487766 RepID=A0A3G4ZX29_9VIRU|nr:MAG: hypothetical protein Faunusvirus16_2 [Faunusvirus sp.]